MDQIVRTVFGESFFDSGNNVDDASTKSKRLSPSPARKSGRSLSPPASARTLEVRDRSVLDNVDAKIIAELETTTGKAKSEKAPPEKVGKLGPAKVHFDVATHVGSFIIGTDRVGVGSQSHFSSIKANVCVFRGKWQYEVLLGSKGVMQVSHAFAFSFAAVKTAP
jgi:hypothetical protein